jgi:hypothetical protein
VHPCVGLSGTFSVYVKFCLSGIKAMPPIQNTFIVRDSFNTDSFCRTQSNPAVSQHYININISQRPITPAYFDIWSAIIGVGLKCEFYINGIYF